MVAATPWCWLCSNNAWRMSKPRPRSWSVSEPTKKRWRRACPNIPKISKQWFYWLPTSGSAWLLLRPRRWLFGADCSRACRRVARLLAPWSTASAAPKLAPDGLSESACSVRRNNLSDLWHRRSSRWGLIMVAASCVTVAVEDRREEHHGTLVGEECHGVDGKRCQNNARPT